MTDVETFGTWTPIPQFEIDNPVFGPPKPHECIAGIQAHIWQLSIDEGRVSLNTDCVLCRDGLWDSALLDDGPEMDPIPVRVEIVSEHFGDDYLVYVNVIPTTTPGS